MEKEYKLRSRYGDTNYLVLDEDGTYRLKAEFNFRVIFDEPKEEGGAPNVVAVDPSGGPFMERGFHVANGVVIKDFVTNKEMNPIKIILEKK